MAEPANPPQPSDEVHTTYRPRFESYAEYIEKLLSKPGANCYEGYAQLRDYLLEGGPQYRLPPNECLSAPDLFRVYKSDKPVFFQRFSKAPSDLVAYPPPPNLQADELRSVLASYSSDVECQIVVLECMYRTPDPWVIDTLGLVLDMDPEIWLYFLAQIVDDGTGRALLRVEMWMRRDDFLSVGGNQLMILKEVPGIRLKTGT